MSNEQQFRQALFDAVQNGVAHQLIRASAGNFSVRLPDGRVMITPAGIPYDVLRPEQMAIVDLDGQQLDGICRPSSETPMHTAIYRQVAHVGAICHTHSVYAMTFAVLGREIPVINGEILTCGGPIPVAPWASPGSAAGGEVTVAALNERPDLRVILLRNHGLVAIGATLKEAYKHAYEAEIGAQVYYQALQIGQPHHLSAEQIQEVKDIYGF